MGFPRFLPLNMGTVVVSSVLAYGNIESVNGDIYTAAGDIVASDNLIATAGNVLAVTGNVNATLGNIRASAGEVRGVTVTADTSLTTAALTATGNVTLTNAPTDQWSAFGAAASLQHANVPDVGAVPALAGVDTLDLAALTTFLTNLRTTAVGTNDVVKDMGFEAL